MTFDGWLDARDSATVEREWATLGARRVQIGQWAPPLQIRPEGAALLAARVLGGEPDRFAWWATERSSVPPTWPSPTFEASRAVSRSFLDHEHDVVQAECFEEWRIREVIEGARGVQHITVDCTWGPMTREGGEGTSRSIVRVFDRSTARAVSIPLHSTAVWVVGELDLSPLDLFARRTGFKLAWRTYDLDSLRGVLAQLVADLDAHFDTSPAWPGGVIRDEIVNPHVRWRDHRFASEAYAITFDECLDPGSRTETGWLVARVHGLPWGHEVAVRIDPANDPVYGIEGHCDLTLPRAQLEATLARLAAIPGLVVLH